jgi:hypothetical protein
MLETGNYLTSEPEILRSKPGACQAGICPSPERTVLARVGFAILVVFSVMFFVSFSNPAYAHGMHGTNAAQMSELYVEVAVPVTDAIMEKASDDTVGECGANCCSMSGCGYVPHKLPQLFSPKTLNGAGYVFNYLPWVENPLDTLQRPPRSIF